MLACSVSAACSSPATLSPEGGRLCVVCGRMAKFRHYGVICCEACCVFFKRTIQQSGKQTCRCAKRGALSSNGRVLLCSYCRLKQCFAAGMTVPGLESFTDLDAVYGLTKPGDSPLRVVCALRQAFAVNRVRKLVEFGISESGVRAATHASLSTFYATERRLLENFLLSLDEIQSFLPSHGAFEFAASRFFPIWSTFETLVLTAKHLGFLKRQLHMVDGSVISLKFDDFAEYCATNRHVKDPEAIARLCLDKFLELLSFSANLHRIRADEVEIAALFELVFAHYAVAWFDSASSKAKFINRVLENLQIHYEQSGGDIATRLGAMMMLVGEFHRVQLLCKEVLVIVELCSNRTENKPQVASDGSVTRTPRGMMT